MISLTDRQAFCRNVPYLEITMRLRKVTDQAKELRMIAQRCWLTNASERSDVRAILLQYRADLGLKATDMTVSRVFHRIKN